MIDSTMRSEDTFVWRMKPGSDRPTVFMPWYGEFGVMLMYWVRYVHHFSAPDKVVCCRRGEEAYYPSARYYWSDFEEPVPDERKRGAMHRIKHCESNKKLRTRIQDAIGEVEWQYPRRIKDLGQFELLGVPMEPSPRRGLSVDVTIGPRNRRYKPQRNWNHWSRLVDSLQDRGLRVGLVGRQETTFDLPQAAVRAWEVGDDAAANIELLQNSRLYIGTDTGTSHLAALLGVQSVLFRFPDPWSYLEAMKRSNPNRCEIVAGGWKDPDAVWNTVRACLSS